MTMIEQNILLLKELKAKYKEVIDLLSDTIVGLESDEMVVVDDLIKVSSDPIFKDIYNTAVRIKGIQDIKILGNKSLGKARAELMKQKDKETKPKVK